MKQLTKDQQAYVAYGIASEIRQSINDVAQKRFDAETHSSLFIQEAIEKSLLKFFDVVFDDAKSISNWPDWGVGNNSLLLIIADPTRLIFMERIFFENMDLTLLLDEPTFIDYWTYPFLYAIKNHLRSDTGDGK